MQSVSNTNKNANAKSCQIADEVGESWQLHDRALTRTMRREKFKPNLLLPTFDRLYTRSKEYTSQRVDDRGE